MNIFVKLISDYINIIERREERRKKEGREGEGEGAK
jgi:hypothetical protein